MSEASRSAAPAPAGRHHRSARNYLLDTHFQLKYTGFLVGIALFLSIALGLIVWNTSRKVVEQSRAAVEQGQETVERGHETVERGKQVLVQSKRVSQVVSMNIAKEYKDDPELAKTFSESAAEDERKLAEEQIRLERDAADLKKQAEELRAKAVSMEEQQRIFLVGLWIMLTLLVVTIGVAGIIFTHKIAGPVFKMKRLLRQVGEGKLVLRERLRKGDELQHFFEAFEKMVDALREHQKGEIAKVDAIIAKLDDAPVSQRGNKEVDANGMAMLKKLRRDMQAQVEL
jgi:nitrogen fixation/metabolism regulation signal transduction histidine kinase